MKQELAQDIALMRYSMISPLIVGLPDEYRSKEAYFRAASARGALHPNGFFIHPVIIPELSEPPVRTLGATIPENESHIFR
mgnify:CR=1 FL=1